MNENDIRRDERRICAALARKMAAYWRELAAAQTANDARIAASISAEAAEEVAKEIEEMA